MTLKKNLSASLVLACALPAGMASAGVEFEYRVDRFTFESDNYSFVEEFNGGLENWNREWGTVYVEDGYVVFTDPGFEVSYPGFEPTLNISNLGWAIAGADGSSFVSNSTWSADYLPEPPGGFLGQTFRDTAEPNFLDHSFFNINLGNQSEAVNNAFGFSGSGPMIAFTELTALGEFVDTQRIAIDYADITGDVVLQLMFDESFGEMNASYSLDGGETFESPFVGRASSGRGIQILIGDPVELTAVPLPAAAWLFGSALLSLLGIRRHRA